MSSRLRLPVLSTVLVSLAILGAALRLPAVTAFPGATGFGANSVGGRGGTVYHVTNLNDSGTGSFRDAVSHSGRIIVFDVGGYIHIVSPISASSNLTIAGQTAPGGGIAVEGGEVSFDARSNIILRYMRFRQGSFESDTSKSGINLLDGNNIILDHVSIEFAEYDSIDASNSNSVTTNYTIQYCIIADPCGQQFGIHAEQAGGQATFLNNLFANSHNRNIMGKINDEFVNNIDYNCSAGYTVADTGTAFKHDFINNYFIGGPAGNSGFLQIDSNQSFYETGDLQDTNRDSVLNGSSVSAGGGGPILTSPWTSLTLTLPVLSPQDAFVQVAASGGAFPHDQVDTLVINQMLTTGNGPTGYTAGTAGPSSGLYTTQTVTGLANSGYGLISSGTAQTDTDQDGMPDYWENAMGSNPNVDDHNTVDANGYTLIEDYLNWLAAPHATVQTSGNTDVDLTQYTTGLTNVTYIVGNAQNGTVALNGNLTSAHFIPTPGFSGLASFDFSATGTSPAGTSTINGTVTVLATPTPPVIVVIPPPLNVQWVGNATNVWDNNDASNPIWRDTSSNGFTDFITGYVVNFDDTGSNSPACNISTVLNLGDMVVNNSVKSFTFTGNGSGSLTGGALTKTGTATMTVTSLPMTFINGVDIQQGTIALGSGASLPGGNIILESGSLLALTGSGNPSAPLIFHNGTVTCGSNITFSTASTIPTGYTGNFVFSNGVNLFSVNGGGTLTLNVPGTGVDSEHLEGTWSTFTGNLIINGTASTGLANLTTYINSALFDNLSKANVTIHNINFGSRDASSGSTLTIGALNGDATAVLGGGHYAAPLVYSIGGLNQDMVFAGAITNSTNSTAGSTNFNANTTLIKTGTGAFYLTGVSTYTNITTVSAGKLIVNGSLAKTAITVASSATLGGNGTIGNGLVTLSSGSSLSPGSAAGIAGTLKLGTGGLTLNGVSLLFDLTSNPAGANDAVTMGGGVLTFSGTNTLTLNLLNGGLGAGTYNLISGGASTTGTTTNLSLGSYASNTRQILTLSVPAGKLQLTVVGSPGSLVWSGAANGTWDPNNSANWLNGGSADKFFNLDGVTFDDTGANTTVTLVGSIAPGNVTINNTNAAYVFGGASITGSGALIKTGSGSLTLGVTNSYSGGTLLAGGNTTLGSAFALGTGNVTLAGANLTLPAAVTIANPFSVTANSSIIATGSTTLSGAISGSGNLVLQLPSGIFTPQGNLSAYSGTLFITGAGNLRFNTGSFGWNFANATLDLTGTTVANNRSTASITLTLGALAGDAGTTLRGSDQTTADGTTCTVVVGGLNQDSVFSGNIVDSFDSTNNVAGQSVALTKVGNGTLTLAGNSTYSGVTSVQAGTLNVSGTVSNQSSMDVLSGATLQLSNGTADVNAITIESNATLSGNGTVTGDLVINGVVSSSGGTITVQGDLTNNSVMRLTGGTQLAVGGTFTNNGVLDLITGNQTVPSSLVNHGTVLLSSAVQQVSSYSITPGSATLQIQSYIGHNFQLQSTTALGSAWQNIGAAQAGTGSILTFVDNSPAGSPIFYRIVVTP